MPLYEYTCRDCDRQCELLVRGQEKPQCPSCDSRRLERLLSVPAAHSRLRTELPQCQPRPSGGCGLPQCGMGGCAME
jgi:putative FmdB family regulatory protein